MRGEGSAEWMGLSDDGERREQGWMDAGVDERERRE